MKYCVIKNTTKVIDGSNNPAEIMLRNAQNAGFTESEVEILTEEEYQARVELEPEPIREPTETEILTDYIVEVDFRVVLLELGLI